MEIAIGVCVAEPGTDRVIDEEQVGKLIPPALVVLQRMVVLEPIRPNFHQCTIHGATSWATIQPNDSALPVRDVTILEMPEEQVAVGVGIDLDVSRIAALGKSRKFKEKATS
jgi:hypothetical protein